MNLKKLMKEGNIDRRVGVFIAIMSTIVLLIILLIINRNIERNNEIKVESLTELTNIYSKNIQIDTEKIIVGLNYVSAYLANRYEMDTLYEDNARKALDILLDNNPMVHAGFIFINNDSIINKVDLDKMIEKEIAEKEELPSENKKILDNDSSDDDIEEIITKHIKKNDERTGNQNISVLAYRNNDDYEYSDLSRIRSSNNTEINETERKYKISYVNALLTGQMQVMEPTLARYGDKEKRTITYTCPVLVDGYVKGVVGMDLDYDKTDENFINIMLTKNAEYSIINNDGKILTALTESVLGKNVKEAYSGGNKTFLEDALGSGKTEYRIHGNEVLVVVPIFTMGTQTLNLLGEFVLNDSYATNITTTVIIAVSIVALFILFCISVWLIFSRMLNARFKEIYERFTKTLSVDIVASLKESIEKLSHDVDKSDNVINNENEIENTESTEQSIQKSDEEIDEILANASEVLIDETKKEEKTSEDVNNIEPQHEEIKFEESMNEETKAEETKEESSDLLKEAEEKLVAKVETEEVNPEEAKNEEVKVEEPKNEETLPDLDLDGVDDLINSAKDDVIEESKEESKEEKNEVDEILANKEGTVTDEASLKETEEKLVAKVETEEVNPEEAKVEEVKNEETLPDLDLDGVDDLINSAKDDVIEESKEESKEVKNEVDEILANKEGTVTDDALLKEVEEKLVAKVEAEEEKNEVDEILANKEGTVTDEASLKEAEEKLVAKVENEEVNHEEAKVEEVKVEESKNEETLPDLDLDGVDDLINSAKDDVIEESKEESKEVKNEVDEILANKEGTVTDDALLKEAEEKLVAKVEAEEEKNEVDEILANKEGTVTDEASLKEAEEKLVAKVEAEEVKPEETLPDLDLDGVDDLINSAKDDVIEESKEESKEEKNEVDEILANKEGTVTDDALLKEAEEKLVAKMEALKDEKIEDSKAKNKEKEETAENKEK